MDEGIDFDAPDDDEQEQADPPRKSPAEQRLDREKAKLKKQVEELTAWKAEREKADRGATVAEVAKSIGMNPKHAMFYQDDDSSPEALKAWGIANDFLVADADEEPAAAPTTGFTPTAVAGSTPPGMKSYSFEEYEELRKSDPYKADEVRKAGRVQPVERPWATQP